MVNNMEEVINAKRQLGNGRWDRALKKNLTALSVADTYEEAYKEWIATGNVFQWTPYSHLTGYPDWVANSQNGECKCLCGHSVIYHFEIENQISGLKECVGSDHINTYLIAKAIEKELNKEFSSITDEEIEEWINVRVRSMKAKAWWEENGNQFETMFNAIKEIDLWHNVIVKNETVYDDKTQYWTHLTQLRKKGKGTFASPNYQMASIVWRWNHPDNPKSQINTTGFPNEKLMQDLALFYVKVLSELRTKYDEYVQKRNARIEYLRQKEELKLRQQEERRLRILEEERKRQEYLQSDEYKELQRQRELQRQQEIERLERERKEEIERQKRVLRESILQNKQFLDEMNQDFIWGCEFYSIVPFNSNWITSKHTFNFLMEVKQNLLDNKKIDSHSISVLRNLAVEFQPTNEQLIELKNLGFNEPIYSKKEASIKIRELKGENE